MSGLPPMPPQSLDSSLAQRREIAAVHQSPEEGARSKDIAHGSMQCFVRRSPNRSKQSPKPVRWGVRQHLPSQTQCIHEVNINASESQPLGLVGHEAEVKR